MPATKKKSLHERLLTIFGDIFVYRWPMFLLYNPEGYRVRGEDVRALLERLQPGDILVRGYDHYLDSRFIPGYFSHVGLYLGEVTLDDQDSVARVGAALLAGGKTDFRCGPQMVIHALAEGVLLEDAINFCRCDFLALLRFPERLRVTNATWKPEVGRACFSPEERSFCDRLARGEELRFAEVFPTIKQAALGKLGTPYDFDFDFQRLDRLSCSELVYYATKALGPFLDVSSLQRRFLFFKHSIIEPDAFVRAPLEVAWTSGSVDTKRLASLRVQRSSGS